MRAKHRKTLHRIFENPVRSDIRWTDIESMLVSFGAVVEEGSGSRVNVALNKRVAVFHRPHPSGETNKGAIKDLRDFLLRAGVSP